MTGAKKFVSSISHLLFIRYNEVMVKEIRFNESPAIQAEYFKMWLQSEVVDVDDMSLEKYVHVLNEYLGDSIHVKNVNNIHRVIKVPHTVAGILAYRKVIKRKKIETNVGILIGKTVSEHISLWVLLYLFGVVFYLANNPSSGYHSSYDVIWKGYVEEKNYDVIVMVKNNIIFDSGLHDFASRFADIVLDDDGSKYFS
jgi:hypothetical protein